MWNVLDYAAENFDYEVFNFANILNSDVKLL
jgi:hypothetical protein